MSTMVKYVMADGTTDSRPSKDSKITGVRFFHSSRWSCTEGGHYGAEHWTLSPGGRDRGVHSGYEYVVDDSSPETFELGFSQACAGLSIHYRAIDFLVEARAAYLAAKPFGFHRGWPGGGFSFEFHWVRASEVVRAHNEDTVFDPIAWRSNERRQRVHDALAASGFVPTDGTIDAVIAAM